jgi:hypothetical protein
MTNLGIFVHISEREDEEVEETPTYTIYRKFQDNGGEKLVMKQGATLEEAREWCNHPEASSKTATFGEAIMRTECNGHWFDFYEEE